MALTIAQRARIIWRAAQLIPFEQIATEVGCHKKTVQNIVTIWLREGRIEPNKSTGRKRKTSEDDDKNIVTAGILYKFKSVSQIMDLFLQEFNLPITETTFYKRLKENGLRSRIMAKKPKLTQAIKQK
jgi:transposase